MGKILRRFSMCPALRESRHDGRKLASYEVAGGGGQNEFVLKARWMARMFRRPFRTVNFLRDVTRLFVSG
jgi:hypothetical protein